MSRGGFLKSTHLVYLIFSVGFVRSQHLVNFISGVGLMKSPHLVNVISSVGFIRFLYLANDKSRMGLILYDQGNSDRLKSQFYVVSALHHCLLFFYRSYVNRQHFHLQSFASLCFFKILSRL